MRIALKLLTSSAFMMAAALIISLVTNFSGFYKDFLLPNGFTTDITSNLTILLLAVMMTVSLSRIPGKNLSPTQNPVSLARGIVIGVFIASVIPIIGFLLLKDTSYGQYAKGLVFVAATPFAASVAPLSFILRGDMEHACRTTIYGYIVSLVWIPILVFILLDGTTVDMKGLVIAVIECVGIPLLISRFLTKVPMNKTVMAVVLNCIIGFLVWMSVSSTAFPGGPEAMTIVAIFLLVGAFRTFGFGITVEVIEKRMGVGWSQRVTDILTMSYKNKGIAIALCVATMGPLVPVAMVAIALSVIMETIWVVFMDSVLFTKKRMRRELEREGSEIGDL